MLDPRLKEAIHDAVEREGQPRTVGVRLIKWLEATVSGNIDLFNNDEAFRRCELLMDAVKLKKSR